MQCVEMNKNMYGMALAIAEAQKTLHMKIGDNNA